MILSAEWLTISPSKECLSYLILSETDHLVCHLSRQNTKHRKKWFKIQFLTEPDVDIFLYRALLDPFDGLMDTGRGLQIDQFSHWKEYVRSWYKKLSMQNSRYFSIFRKQTEDPLISISAMKQTQSVLKRRKWTSLHLSLLVEQDKKKVSHCEAALATIQCKFSSLGGTHSSCPLSPFNAWNWCSFFTSRLKRRRTFSS